jgi:hypothetical protein
VTDQNAEIRDIIEMTVNSTATRRAIPDAIIEALTRAGFVISRPEAATE